MLPETRARLQEFYRPFNARLARVMAALLAPSGDAPEAAPAARVAADADASPPPMQVSSAKGTWRTSVQGSPVSPGSRSEEEEEEDPRWRWGY